VQHIHLHQVWARVDLAMYSTMNTAPTLPACVFCSIAAAPGGKSVAPEVLPDGGLASALLTVIPIFAGRDVLQLPEHLLHIHRWRYDMWECFQQDMHVTFSVDVPGWQCLQLKPQGLVWLDASFHK